MHMRRVLLSDTGDTIVEVLIAIIIVSAVLGGAYVSASRSLSVTRQSQERGEALKFAEEQVERLKTAIPTSPDTFFNAANVFCIDSANAKQDATVSPNYTISNSLPVASADNFSNYNSACAKGPVDSLTGKGRYNIATEYYGNPDNVFKVHVRWAEAGGNNNDELVITYRIVK